MTNCTGQSGRVDECVRERSHPVLPGSARGGDSEVLLRKPVIMAAVISPVWVPVVSSAVGGIMAIAGGIVTQQIIAGKEKRAHERKIASERAYLGSQLLVSLMEFRDRCQYFADCPEWPGMMIPAPPGLVDFEDTEGDWSVPPGALLLRIRRLPLLQKKFNQAIRDYFEEYGADFEYSAVATDRYQKLGQECESLVIELCILCRLPSDVYFPELHESGHPTK